ncbi:MAG: transglycosylase domain-containing protein, partial [Candidatus Gracilibacteria bacterium]
MVKFIHTRLSGVWHRYKPQPHESTIKRYIKWLILGILAAIGTLFVITLGFVIVFSFTSTSLEDFQNSNLEQSTIIYDREGNQLYAIHGEENRVLVDLSEISPYLVDATIATEDDDFYNHFGFDVKSLTRAFVNNLLGKPVSGASTITQQFVKNTFLSPEKSYVRKLKELVLAVKVEILFTKDEILEMYLNEIPYGSNAYGAQLAAQTYFDKDASGLTLTESAILAAIPNAPTYYSPYGDHKYSTIDIEFTAEELDSREIKDIGDLDTDEYTEGLIGKTYILGENDSVYIPGRTDTVLDRMIKEGYITEDDKLASITEAETLEFKPVEDNMVAPHFVLYVKQLLEDKYGKEFIEQGGLKVYTTLDADMQQAAEDAIAKYKDTNLEKYGASNAALFAIQPVTGQILAMVGSADYNDESISGNVNVVTRLRKPGSSFKPFVYALAFLNGYSPATILYDVQTYFGNDAPKNFDGIFSGPISIREALGYSKNIPAIKAFFLAGGEEAVVNFAEQTFGISSLNHDNNYSYTIVLGSAEVSLFEMVNGYMVFANGGYFREATPILKVENMDGDILEQWEEGQGTQVLDEQVAYLITNVLSDDTYNLGSNLRVSGQFAAAKSGTSNNDDMMPDNGVVIGYTVDLLAGVWVGNSSGSGMSANASCYSTGGPIWKEFMTNALKDTPAKDFPRPAGIKEVAVSKATGKLPSEYTPSDAIKTEIFASFAVPTEIDDGYMKYIIDSDSGKIATQYTPEGSKKEVTYRIYGYDFAQYPSWVTGVQNWIASQAEAGNIELPPSLMDDVHTAETIANSPTITITSPSSLSTIETGESEIEVDIYA